MTIPTEIVFENRFYMVFSQPIDNIYTIYTYYWKIAPKVNRVVDFLKKNNGGFEGESIRYELKKEGEYIKNDYEQKK